jgi:hypothetical protein
VPDWSDGRAQRSSPTLDLMFWIVHSVKHSDASGVEAEVQIRLLVVPSKDEASTRMVSGRYMHEPKVSFRPKQPVLHKVPAAGKY